MNDDERAKQQNRINEFDRLARKVRERTADIERLESWTAGQIIIYPCDGVPDRDMQRFTLKSLTDLDGARQALLAFAKTDLDRMKAELDAL